MRGSHYSTPQVPARLDQLLPAWPGPPAPGPAGWPTSDERTLPTPPTVARIFSYVLGSPLAVRLLRGVEQVESRLGRQLRDLVGRHPERAGVLREQHALEGRLLT